MNSSAKPRGLLLVDRPGWAFDFAARELIRRASDVADLEIAYVVDDARVRADAFDFVYVFFWGETAHLQWPTTPRMVIKEVSSARWRYDPLYRTRSDREAVERYMADAMVLVSTSPEITRTLRQFHPRVCEYRLGVDVERFRPADTPRTGPLSVGWAGRPDDPAKRFREVFVPGVANRPHVSTACGEVARAAMADYFRGIDVFCVTSISEGTPLPLLEAMASGCFVISTRVGVAEEMIEHEVNGLFIDSDADSLRAALSWCDGRAEFVRNAGRGNAQRVAASRTWEHAARAFRDIIGCAMGSTAGAGIGAPPVAGYRSHFARINPAEDGEQVYRAQAIAFDEEFLPYLPADSQASILEIGPGYGHLLRWLRERGYCDLTAVEKDRELAERLIANGVMPASRVHCAEAGEWLAGRVGTFDLVLLCDVIEHVNDVAALRLVRRIREVLRPGGRVVLRTPNMANLLAGYSRYIDRTHREGYTEWSLLALLDEAGFAVTGLLLAPRYASRRRRWKAALQRRIHRALYRLDERTMPRVFAKNIVAWGQR